MCSHVEPRDASLVGRSVRASFKGVTSNLVSSQAWNCPSSTSMDASRACTDLGKATDDRGDGINQQWTVDNKITNILASLYMNPKMICNESRFVAWLHVFLLLSRGPFLQVPTPAAQSSQKVWTIYWAKTVWRWQTSETPSDVPALI